MGTKVFFVGNVFGGDDGIGPYLYKSYKSLKDNPELAGIELIEAGVIGFDMISYVENGDTVIMVDAVHTKSVRDKTPDTLKAAGKIGSVMILTEKELLALSPGFSLVSMHDFGVEQTVGVMRTYAPALKQVYVLGILVSHVQPFSETLSEELMSRIHDIEKDVLKEILRLAGKEH